MLKTVLIYGKSTSFLLKKDTSRKWISFLIIFEEQARIKIGLKLFRLFFHHFCE